MACFFRQSLLEGIHSVALLLTLKATRERDRKSQKWLDTATPNPTLERCRGEGSFEATQPSDKHFWRSTLAALVCEIAYCFQLERKCVQVCIRQDETQAWFGLIVFREAAHPTRVLLVTSQSILLQWPLTSSIILTCHYSDTSWFFSRCTKQRGQAATCLSGSIPR